MDAYGCLKTYHQIISGNEIFILIFTMHIPLSTLNRLLERRFVLILKNLTAYISYLIDKIGIKHIFNCFLQLKLACLK